MDQENHKDTNMSSSEHQEPLSEEGKKLVLAVVKDEEEDREESDGDGDDHEFSKEELMVAEILLQLPELIRICPKVALGDEPIWLFKKKRSVIHTLLAPPPSPEDPDAPPLQLPCSPDDPVPPPLASCSADDDHDTMEDEASKKLRQKINKFTTNRRVFLQELERISSYQEKQRAFNLLLKDAMKNSLQQEDENSKAATSNGSIRVEFDDHRPTSQSDDEDEPSS